MKTDKSFLRALGSLAALIGLVGLLAAMPANAAKLSGKTILAPNSESLDALASLGVEVEVYGKAKVGGNGVVFPLVSGKFDPETGATKAVHKGGLTFVGTDTELTVENFVVKIGDKNVLKASLLDGSKLRLADLDTKKLKIKEKGEKAVVSNVTATLSKKGAKALSETFGIDEDLQGAELGTIKTKIDLNL